MRTAGCVLVALLLCGPLGCRGESAEQMLRTAQFEELQHNPEHARQLYERLLRDHPDTPEAQQAAERLQALAAPSPPAAAAP